MDAVDLVRSVVSGELYLGDPRASGALTVIPIFGAERSAPAYVVAAEAMAEGTLTVEEFAGVNELVVRNRGARPALLLDGEHLIGAKQNRVLNVTVLVPAKADTPIPVSCVEQGRYTYRDRRTFVSAPEIAHPSLRMDSARSHAVHVRAGRGHLADQDLVWRHVDSIGFDSGSRPSATAALRDVFSDRWAELSSIAAGVSYSERDQIGVVACFDGRPKVVDVFDHPSTLEMMWPRLVAGYALNAVGHRPGPVDAQDAVSLLSAVVAGEATTHRDVGLGTQVIATSPDVVANALVWNDRLVHLAVFAQDEPGSITARPR